MVVDDSLTARTVLCKIIDKAPDLTLAATANTAEQAIEALKGVDVDVILLDLEMPGIGGLAGLPAILEEAGDAQVLVVSALTAKGAEVTIAALSMGAADTVQKPEPGHFNSAYRAELADRIRALASGIVKGRAARPARADAVPAIRKAPKTSVRCLAIGGSTGGIHSLCQFLGQLPRDYPAPIVITQHLPTSFVPIFASQVQIAAGRPTRIAEDGMTLVPGEVLVAPGDGHVTFVKKRDKVVVQITYESAPSGCCPSVDPMLASLADALDGELIGVVLSGMGRDGSIGGQQVVDKGGIMLAECPETCAVWGMPRGIAEAGIASQIASPVELAKWVAARRILAA
ncbi:hypothetical protein AAW01_07835 [Aurantiacibacter gangjinensis]|uniref:protein-glutamate methylesterase n=2 Tax=Aurantiacibacter gangjinensis TaxID=502682 RepID=A0A0G9MQ98_9SPHN|nr:hypothetical protein AAW01_07835 [Aurantiacibacter gangjinensis]